MILWFSQYICLCICHFNIVNKIETNGHDIHLHLQSLPSGEVVHTFYRCLYSAVIN